MKIFKPFIATLLLLLVLTSCVNQYVPPVPKEKLISQKTAKQYINQYNSVKYKAISEATGKPDALEFYYTIEQLEGYINYAKNEARKKGYAATGIAISLAAYPQDVHVAQKQNGLTTIILRPYGHKIINRGGVLPPPNNNDDIIESIDPMNDSNSSPPIENN